MTASRLGRLLGCASVLYAEVSMKSSANMEILPATAFDSKRRARASMGLSISSEVVASGAGPSPSTQFLFKALGTCESMPSEYLNQGISTSLSHHAKCFPYSGIQLPCCSFYPFRLWPRPSNLPSQRRSGWGDHDFHVIASQAT